MAFWDFLKKKKETVLKEEIKKDIEDIKNILPQTSTKPICNHTCQLCEKSIGEERYSKQAGKYFHKKCYENILRKARNGGISYAR